MVDKEMAGQVRNLLGENGFIYLGVKARNTERNQATLDAFRLFCKEEADNDYTLGLRILLKGFEEDFKYAAVRDLVMENKVQIDELRNKITDLEAQLKSKKEDTGAF